MDDGMNRHEFFSSLFRKGAMVGMGGVALAATHGSKSPEECLDTTTHCAKCWANHDCTLPEKGLDPHERAEKNRQA